MAHDESRAGQGEPADVGEHYHQRQRQFEQQAAALERRCRQLTWGRSGLFLAAMVMALAAASPDVRWVAAVVSGLLLSGFVALCAWQEMIWRRQRSVVRLRDINRRGRQRWLRQWESFPAPQVDVPRRHLAISEDLDLFGPASLYQLACRAHTREGRQRLAHWLTEPALSEEIVRRQQAVSELAPRWELREELELRGLGVAAGTSTPGGLVGWAEQGDWLSQQLWLRWLARLLPLLVLAPLAAAALGHLPGLCLRIAVAAAVASFLTALAISSRAFETLSQISTSRDEVGEYQGLFALAVSIGARSPWLAELVAQLSDPHHGPAVELKRLSRVTWISAQRRAGLLQSVLYMICQVVLLLDVHLLAALERWRVRNQHRVAEWFSQLGQLEAAASLAGLAFDHPDWSLPQVRGDSDLWRGQAVGHPLLPDATRVPNDVGLGPPGTLLLVTGSNMSGKSTLLRSIGLNTVLAQAGGPVCALQLSLPPVRLASSVRVHDSLSEGVSFFMAELRRLKQIVDQSRQHPDEHGRRLLFLLDEILQGTNSAERQIAVTRVLDHLLEAGTFGAVSTHDLELAALPELSSRCQTVHFRETIDASGDVHSMTFDYRLRQGVATTTNALKLLELVGLV